MLRYPGEKCDKDLYPCINGIECVKGKCKGKKKMKVVWISLIVK